MSPRRGTRRLPPAAPRTPGFLYLGWLPFRDAYHGLGLTRGEMDQFLSLLPDREFVMLSNLPISVRARRGAE